jgi:cysteinyl-tRNA synthetase
MTWAHRLRLFNTETRSLQEVFPSSGNEILMYTCGPTVYNFAHIGNFRTYVFEDLLRRSLKFFGMEVKQAMNLTDVDDKTIKGALERGGSLEEYTQPYIEAFFEDLKALNIEPVEFYPAATDYIPDMIRIIEKLIEKGVAYVGVDRSVYYAIDSFPSYGRLSHLPICDLRAGASERVCSDEYDKENISDFVLWKIYDPERDGNIYWESPFGKGRPGWHIECSAMAMKLLGETIDIHVGGVDNMFPHHENEIAQSEAFSGKHFVKHWLHVEHLLVDHKKMSKSLGNFYTLRDLLKKGYTGQQVRYALLQTHYRMQLNFTFAGLDGAASSLQRICDFRERLQTIEGSSCGLIEPIVQKTTEGFVLALSDDLNISVALAHLFDAIREINALCDQRKIGKEEAASVLAMLQLFDAVLGVLPLQTEENIPLALQEALQNRQKARQEKNWALADQYRDLIHSQGYRIEDSPTGARLKKQRTETA